MRIHESAENYLETILVLSMQKNSVRSVDIAIEMGFSKPSVSIAMKKLRESGYVEIDDGGGIHLTSAGRSIAEAVYERHTLIAGWLESIGVDKQTAVEDACRIEHDISNESFEKIKEYLISTGVISLDK